jgi:hypothetical protein
MDLFTALCALYRFCRGRCPDHNEPLGKCRACLAQFDRPDRGSMWD